MMALQVLQADAILRSADLLWDVLGPIGITAISAALLFIGVEAVRWRLGG